MISLRQHAISLAAVFLALAVGVVLGSGVLSDTLLSGLRDQKKDLQGQIAQLTSPNIAIHSTYSPPKPDSSNGSKPAVFMRCATVAKISGR